MERLCGRPGCSDPASVAYGMRAEDLVFWLDTLGESGDAGGVLCRRHADSMVVPRDWTLDDLRDPDLHLFRPPDATDGLPRPARRRRTARELSVEQLVLGVEHDADPQSPGSVEENGAPEPWLPDFDDGDDLGGLLAADSPLLARAFRGADRPRSS